MSCTRGADAETVALHFLERHGLRLLGRNYRCRLGEIDLVMQDAGTLVFVEVRARTDNRHGGAAASVGPWKQHRVALAARHYLMTHPRAAALPARFDVVAISGPDSENAIEWIRAAFDCAG